MKLCAKLKNAGKRYLDAKKEKIIFRFPVEVSREDLLRDKIAVITGGSGGIGSAIAKELLLQGAKVVLLGTNKEKLEAAREKLGAGEDTLKIVCSDLRKISAFSSLVAEIEVAFPEDRVDILVNCAGITATHDFWNTTEEEFDKIMDVNLKGMYFFTREIARAMKEKHVKGHILNVSSSSSVRPAWTPYQMSKWAINGFTKGLADLLIQDGIVVNAIAPGPTATSVFGLSESDPIGNPSNPAGRFVLPDEVASLAAHMVGPLGDMIVGDTFFITGGSGIISYHR